MRAAISHATTATCVWFTLVGVLCAAETTPPGKAAPLKTPPIKVERTAGSDWPAFLGPTGDSKSVETGILTTWPAEGPPIAWQSQLKTSYGMPTISRGRLFHAEREGDTVRVLARESETGKFLWKYEYPSDYQDLYGYDNGPRCSPVVDGDRVYMYGAEGMLHCLDVATGKLIWKVDTIEKFGVIQNFFGVGSTPIVEGKLLIVQVGGSPEESKQVPPGQLSLVKPNGTGIVAFDKLTGEVVYKLGDELASYSSPTLATIEGRRWGFLFARGGLLGFNPQTGKLDFHFPWRAPILESVNASDPVVVGNQVFISETYGPGSALLQVKPGQADVIWSDAANRRDKAMQTHWSTPIHHEGYLYGSSGRHESNAELRCIELKTGKVLWSEPGLTRSSLLYVDGHFVCLSEDGTLRLLRATPEKFDEVAKVVLKPQDFDPAELNFGTPRLLKPPAWAAPIVSHGLLYVRGRDRLVCLELIPPAKNARKPAAQ